MENLIPKNYIGNSTYCETLDKESQEKISKEKRKITSNTFFKNAYCKNKKDILKNEKSFEFYKYKNLYILKPVKDPEEKSEYFYFG